MPDTQKTTAVAAPEQFQVFTCPRKTAKVVMPNGFCCNFYGGQYITKDPQQIAWLTAEIEEGSFPGFAIGEKVTSDDLDPMLKRRKEALKDLLSASEEDQRKLLASIRDFGTSDAGSGLANSVVTADKLAKLAAMLDAGKPAGAATPAAK